MNAPSTAASGEAIERARAHFFAGNAHFEAGRLDAARADYEAALALVPGRASVLANLGVTLCRQQQWQPAITTLDAALLADPTHADAWAALGLCRETKGLSACCHSRYRLRSENWLCRHHHK